MAMPFPGQLQSLYGLQMCPRDPDFARFNMNELTRAGCPPMVPDMMGMLHPSMTMNTRAPHNFRRRKCRRRTRQPGWLRQLRRKVKPFLFLIKSSFTPILLYIRAFKLFVIAAILEIFSKLRTIRSTMANIDDDVAQKIKNSSYKTKRIDNFMLSFTKC